MSEEEETVVKILEEQRAKEESAMESITRDVSILAEQAENQSLSSGDLDSNLGQLRGLRAQIPLGHPDSARVEAAIQKAEINTKEARTEKEAAETAKMGSAMGAAMGLAAGAAIMTATPFIFSDVVFNQFMSPDEQNFVTGSLLGTQTMAFLDEKGKIKTNAIDGLDNDFARVKYYALDSNDKEAVRTLSSETEASLPEEMAQLKRSLHNLEGFQANRQMERLGPGASEEQKIGAIEATHEKFRDAYDQIDKVERLHDAKTTLDTAAKSAPLLKMNATVAGLALKFNEENLARTLQEGIIDDTLLEKNTGRSGRAAEISTSVDVQEHSRPLDTGAATPSRTVERNFH
jgi:hypothetical protein